MININNIKKVHLIGIGGISMSALAHVFIDRGLEVSGSDQADSNLIHNLIKCGAKIHIGHDASLIKDQDIIIYNGAIKESNPEMMKAKSLNIPLIKRTEIIAEFMKEHKISIAISGTHGKTTTTTMTTMILEEAGLNPSFMIGGVIPNFDDTHRVNESEYIVVESCEYQGSFLDFNPTTLVVNNIEYEHVDFFKDLDHVIRVFDDFANKIDENGYLVINADDSNAVKLIQNKKCKVLTYGIKNDCDYKATNLKNDSTGCYGFDVFHGEDFIVHVDLRVIGKFNVYNALGAIVAAHANGACMEAAQAALKKFQNAQRRFEVLGKLDDATIVSDYAHHPSEIKATVKAALQSGYEKLIVFFQPHTYSRTHALLEDLALAFQGADQVFLVDIYSAREQNTYNISSEDIVKVCKNNNISANYIGDRANIESNLLNYKNANNLLLLMGAGNIDDIAREIAAKIKK